MSLHLLLRAWSISTCLILFELLTSMLLIVRLCIFSTKRMSSIVLRAYSKSSDRFWCLRKISGSGVPSSILFSPCIIGSLTNVDCEERGPVHLPQTLQTRDAIIPDVKLLQAPEVSPGDGLDGLNVVACQENGAESWEVDVLDSWDDVFPSAPCWIIS